MWGDPMRKRPELIGVNEKGYRIGADHQRAKFSDEDVELIRELRAAGLSYGMIREKFDEGLRPSKTQIVRIVKYESRAQYADRWVRPDRKRGKTNHY